MIIWIGAARALKSVQLRDITIKNGRIAIIWKNREATSTCKASKPSLGTGWHGTAEAIRMLHYVTISHLDEKRTPADQTRTPILQSFKAHTKLALFWPSASCGLPPLLPLCPSATQCPQDNRGATSPAFEGGSNTLPLQKHSRWWCPPVYDRWYIRATGIAMQRDARWSFWIQDVVIARWAFVQ